MLFETKSKAPKEIVEYAHKIRNYGIPNVMISMGSKGALLSCDEGDIIACPPAVEVVNTVGCGDSMLGAFAVAVIRAMSAEESIRYAVAVGTANALSPSTGSFDIKEMQKLLPQITNYAAITSQQETRYKMALVTTKELLLDAQKMVMPLVLSMWRTWKWFRRLCLRQKNALSRHSTDYAVYCKICRLQLFLRQCSYCGRTRPCACRYAFGSR